MKAPQRFHSLDALRGIAAFSVVLFHWRFWVPHAEGRPLPVFSAQSLPFGHLMALFYASGDAAVGLFFCLSGFIFYWLYASPIRQRQVTAREFAVGRFSRLYPLHVAALLAISVAQFGYGAVTNGHSFGFDANDPLELLKHLLVFPLAIGHRENSFNAVDWTLAIEAWMYVVFFVLARFVPFRALATLAMLVGAFLLPPHFADIRYGLTAFFMGGLMFLIFERVESALLDRALRILLAVSWIASLALGSGWIDIWRTNLVWLRGGYAIYVLFPATVLYLARREARRSTSLHRLAWFGDMSYSSYMLHLPLMVLCAFALRLANLGLTTMLSPIALIGFFAVLGSLSMASLRFFERPVQQWIRMRFSARRPDDLSFGPAI